MTSIDCSTEDLINGSCTMNTYEVLGSVNPKNKDLKTLSKDFFGGFTMFIGFVVFVALIYSGMLMIFGGADEKQFENGKKGVTYSLIGLLLVGSAYGIIKLIQLIAQG